MRGHTKEILSIHLVNAKRFFFFKVLLVFKYRFKKAKMFKLALPDHSLEYNLDSDKEYTRPNCEFYN